MDDMKTQEDEVKIRKKKTKRAKIVKEVHDK